MYHLPDESCGMDVLSDHFTFGIAKTESFPLFIKVIVISWPVEYVHSATAMTLQEKTKYVNNVKLHKNA